MTNAAFQFDSSKMLPFSRSGKKSLIQPQHPQITSSSLTIADALAKYLKEHAEFEPRTKEDYDRHFRYLKKWADDEGISLELLSHFNKDVIIEYKNYLFSKYAKCTVRIRLNTLRAFLRWCYEEEYLTEPLFLKLKKVKIDEESVRFLTEAQIEALFQVVNLECYEGYRNHCIMLIMLDNGIRISELLKMEWSMIDFENGEILLPGRITKNGKPRKVPLSKEHTIPALRNLQTINENQFPGKDDVFLSYRGNPLDPSSVRHLLRDYGEAVGIKGVSPHRFRHSFARMYVLAGGNMFMLQQILGHSSLEVSRRYVKLFSTEVAQHHQQKSPVNQMFS